MKIGLSSYSLNANIQRGQMNLLDAMRFAAEKGAEHFEVVPIGFSFYDDEKGFDDAFIEQVKTLSDELDLPLSNYAVGADLIDEDAALQKAAIERTCRQVDVAAKLGVKTMRHDISFRRFADSALAFEKYLPIAVRAIREIADYAKELGITTTSENHGGFFNGSDRMIRLVDAVGRDNYGLLLDCGNFICVDEDPLIAVKKCAPMAKMVHLKDFYVRRLDNSAKNRQFALGGMGPWFSSVSGEYMLRGSIVGQGDLDLWSTVAELKKVGYDGYVSIEFEGFENCEQGSEIGMKTAKYMLENV